MNPNKKHQNVELSLKSLPVSRIRTSVEETDQVANFAQDAALKNINLVTLPYLTFPCCSHFSSVLHSYCRWIEFCSTEAAFVREILLFSSDRFLPRFPIETVISCSTGSRLQLHFLFSFLISLPIILCMFCII